MHRPVLLNESIEGLNIQRGEYYIDATAGEGGHLWAMLQKGANVLALDRDENQIKKLINMFKEDKNVTFEIGNFASIEQISLKCGFKSVSGILFDLGLSNEQLQKGGIGLSYKKLDEPLDMRLDKTSEITAKKLINSLNEEQLYKLFAKNSEELYSLQIARAIVLERKRREIKTVGSLVKIIKNVVTDSPNGAIARIFQALRVEVNSEYQNLESALKGALLLVRSGGRIVIISFHPLEDRIVKRFIKNNHLKQLKKKVIKFGRDHFTFERSAKLRVIII